MRFASRLTHYLPSRSALGVIATLLVRPTLASQVPPPVPVFPKGGKIPADLQKQLVFLSDDERSVILTLPTSSAESGRKIIELPIHNQIHSSVMFNLSNVEQEFVYTYRVASNKTSVDSVTTISVVVASADATLTASGTNGWRAVLAKVNIAKRVGITNAPPGSFVMWFCPSGQPLSPGASLGGLTLHSKRKPGFTVAYVAHFPVIDISDSWPEQVLDQLNPVADPAWVDKHQITFGPRYSGDEPVSQMAQDYIFGIQSLVSAGQLSMNSPFVTELSSWLTQAATGQGLTSRFSLSHRPTSEVESEIEAASRECFWK